MLYSLRRENRGAGPPGVAKETEMKKNQDQDWLDWLELDEPFSDAELPRQWREARDDMMEEAA